MKKIIMFLIILSILPTMIKGEESGGDEYYLLVGHKCDAGLVTGLPNPIDYNQCGWLPGSFASRWSSGNPYGGCYTVDMHIELVRDDLVVNFNRCSAEAKIEKADYLHGEHRHVFGPSCP